MATNKILPWAQTGTANVLSDDAYAADVATGGLYGDGVKTGQASSQQANKTWRQATAPGSGLAQFLVDNLSVDVTDADTPATFSSRIANAILKLAQISPFNQSFAAAIGGYRKYAIVSDSSGNFWVSTADQNVTVPGDSGAKWQSLFNGYATQSWVEEEYQPIGDYATNTALQAEASSRASADTNLQNQINGRVLKSGDTMTGPLSTFNAPNLTSGDWNYSPDFRSYTNTRTGFRLFAQDQVDGTSSGVLAYDWNGTITQYWWFNFDGSIVNSKKGNVAFQSDISNLQNQINNRALKSDLPLPEGMHCQVFSAPIPSPCPEEGWVVNIPAGWSTHSFVTACDTGGNVYAVSAKVENATQARLWAKYPTNGAWAMGGEVTVTSYGYY